MNNILFALTRNVFLLASVCMLSFTATASDDFWQSPQAQSQTSARGAADDANQLSASLLTSQQVDVDGRRTEQSAFSITRSFTADSALTFEYATAGEQRNMVLGYTHGQLSVSMMQGKGEDFQQLSGDLNGVDPYLFHGGYKQEFELSGYALDYGFGRFGHMQFGQAVVDADGLASRRARYMEWSNNRMFARASRFDRGGDNVGSGLDLGFAVGTNKLIALQAMELENDKSMRRIRFQFDGKKSRQYWLDLSAHQNPLFRANDDYRVMFNFRTTLGAGKLASYQNESADASGDDAAVEDEAAGAGTDTKTKKKGSGWKRGLFIGAGVAAAAGLSSSGSKSADDLSRFRSKNDAAFEVLDRINPQSIRENREFGGWIYTNIDGSFASTAPVRGEAASVTLPQPSTVIPAGARISASYHTHGAFDPRFDNENFSPTDLEADRANNIDGYLGTPGGQFKLHDIETDTIIVLGRISTI